MICNRNTNAMLGRHVCETGPLEKNKLCLVDIGAREGIQHFWQQLGECLTFIGFDPDIKECDRINGLFRAKGIDFTAYPYAVHDAKGEVRFHLTRFPHSSGFFAADPAFNSRLSEINIKNLEVVGEATVETVALDDFVRETDLPPVNFIKIDTEGSEHLVLEGSRKLLDSRELLGVESEVWIGPIKQSDNIGKIHELMTAAGFHLFDINIGRYPRNTFPRGFLRQDDTDGQLAITRPQPWGQILTGDVVYLRDPVWERMKGLDRFDWNDATVLKMAMLFELYHLPDCAIELLTVYRDQFKTHLDVDRFMDLLTPQIPSMPPMGYRDYVNASLDLHWRELDVFRPHWRE